MKVGKKSFLSHARQKILDFHKNKKKNNPWQPDLYFEEVRLMSQADPLQGPYVMPLVTLRTRPCQWSLRGGCVMCSYNLGAYPGLVTEEMLIAQTEAAIKRLDPNIYPALVFTSNGSFLDPWEVPDEIRPTLVKKLKEAGFKFLVFETRPEFVTSARLESVLDAFTPDVPQKSSVPISVSFGLESSNEYILSNCINKGETIDEYIQAIALLKKNRVPFDCYVLLGKLFLSAEEDIQDAVDTIKFAVDQGAGYVFVMVTNMMPASLLAFFEMHKRYKLPSLWRAVELLKRLPENYRRFVQVKGISHAPVQPLYFAKTCDSCCERVRSSLNLWNQTGDFQHILKIEKCDCLEDFYKNELGQENPEPLAKRIENAHQWLNAELDLDDISRLPSKMAIPS